MDHMKMTYEGYLFLTEVCYMLCDLELISWEQVEEISGSDRYDIVWGLDETDLKSYLTISNHYRFDK